MSVILSLVSFVFSPIGKWVSIGLVIAAAVGGIYGKGYYDSHEAYKAKMERQAADAVTKADAARSAAQKKFDEGKDAAPSPLPKYDPRNLIPHRMRNGSDGFARD